MLSTNRLGQHKCDPCVKNNNFRECDPIHQKVSSTTLQHPLAPSPIPAPFLLTPPSSSLLPSPLEVDGNPPTLGRSVRPSMGERFTSPLPLSAWGSDPTCRKRHKKTVIWQTQRVTQTFVGVPQRLISIPRLGWGAKKATPSTKSTSKM